MSPSEAEVNIFPTFRVLVPPRTLLIIVPRALKSAILLTESMAAAWPLRVKHPLATVPPHMTLQFLIIQGTFIIPLLLPIVRFPLARRSHSRALPRLV